MIKFENTVTPSPDQWESVIMGARNPMNSWDRSDSGCGCDNGLCVGEYRQYIIGPNDHDLLMRLRNAGTDHRKFMRMLPVIVTITAPMYWWSEFDTYKIGTVANSTSKMHKMLAKPFEMNDFSFDKLPGYKNEVGQYIATSVNVFETIARPLVDELNELRDYYLNEKDQEKKKKIWYAILQLLPCSYNQKRTVMLNFEVLTNIYKSRKDHKLDEWREFCDWVKTLPYSELITGDRNENPQLKKEDILKALGEWDKIIDAIRNPDHAYGI